MNPEPVLRRRIKLLTWLFIAGLVLSGATAIPLRSEVNWIISVTGVKDPGSRPAAAMVEWLFKVHRALDHAQPFLFYGTDWLAFGHFVIAITFIGALRDPARNRWLFDFGMIACALVIPYAFIFGGWRGIPVWWRLVDCSFGVFGFVPLWFCRKWAVELERLRPLNKS